MSKHYKKVLIILISFCVLCLLILVSTLVGSVDISIPNIINAVIKGDNEINNAIILNIRLPRVLIAVVVGANLSVSGAILQVVMKNPLADPGITGVSSGASLVAIIIMLLFPAYYSFIPVAAFLGGLFACSLVYILAWKNGIQPMRIILAGVAVNAILGGATALLSILNSEKIQGVLLWLNGSLSAKNWHNLKVLLPYSLLGLILALFVIRYANILQLGDTAATNLGINVNKSRIILSALAVFLAAVSTSIVGIIGFVGLVVPHICRMILGSDYKYLIPLSMIGGSITLLLADTLARTIARPIELPVGILMAVSGGPFFLYLLRRSDKK